MDGKGGASQAEGPCLQRARGRKESSALEELRRVHRACVYPAVERRHWKSTRWQWAAFSVPSVWWGGSDVSSL